MEQKTILTPIQRQFLELVLKERYLINNYYWTGGTVLAEFYLHHRQSEDIDLFCEDKEVHLPSVSKFIGIAGTLLGVKKITHARFLGLESFTFHFKTNKKLKVDFNYYPFPRINKGKKWCGLAIDSLQDIAVNKVHTAAMKARCRDFVDLYFLFKKEKTSLKELISLAKAKFDWDINALQIGENFSKVVTFTNYPKMLVPFSPKEMENFYLSLAKGLKKEIFK